jgi:tetratricopeptide (TPR) repeat protein
MKSLFLAVILLLVAQPMAAFCESAVGQSAASAVDLHAEIAAVLYAASATQAALAKSLDSKLQAQQQQIAALAAEVQAGDVRYRGQMASAQEAFVQALAAQDRQYAVQLSMFRSVVTDIASTQQGAQALERFNAGDEVGAIDILDRLHATNERMREARAKLENAAEGRRIAQLALEARTRGKITTQAVIKRFEDVVQLDPGVWNDWLELAHLYVDAGRLTDANHAAAQMGAVARDDNETAQAFSERSDVLHSQGDLIGARAAAENALKISRRAAAADPKNTELQFTLSRTLISFGEVARQQADFATAQMAYLEETASARRRVDADPSNVRNRRSLAADLLHLSDVYIQLGNVPGARHSLEEIVSIQDHLLAEHPDNIVTQRQIGVTLMWLSDVLVSDGAFADARKANIRIVDTATRLSAADPENAILQRDLVYGLTKTAMLQRIEGDFAGSLQTWRQSLDISRALALSAGAALQMKQDVGTTLTNIGDVQLLQGDFEGSRSSNEEAVSILRKLVSGDKTDAPSRYFLAASLFGLGDALSMKGEHDNARRAYEEGISLDRALAKKSADAADYEFGLSVGQLGLGKLLNRMGDRPAALRSLQQSLSIRKRQAASHIGNSSAERSVAETLRELAATTGSEVSWAEFRAQIEGMQTKRILWGADRGWIDEARSHAAPGGKS